MNLAVDISCILRINKRHVAIDTLFRFFGIIEGQRPLMRNTAFLPLVIVVEAAYPSEIVNWLIEMYFMAG